MKVLIVGLGGIGQRHVRNLRTLYGEKLKLLPTELEDSKEL